MGVTIIPFFKKIGKLALMLDRMTLTEGGTWGMKDANGFDVAYFDDEGNLHMKGEVRKIQ